MEQIKNYWNNQPCNINHSSKEILSKEYFDEIETHNMQEAFDRYEQGY